VSSPLSVEVIELLHSLFEERSLLDRVRGQDHRIANLAHIAASGEVRVVPNLLPLLVDDDALAPHVVQAIAELVRDVTPIQLSWLDERIRPDYYASGRGGLQRIYVLLDSVAPRLSADTARMLRFSIKPV